MLNGSWLPRDQIATTNLPGYDLAMRATPPDCRDHGLWLGGNAELPLTKHSQAVRCADSASFSCPSCEDGVFRSSTSFRAHLASVHRRGLPCNSCHFIAPGGRPGNLTAHIKMMHSDDLHRVCPARGRMRQGAFYGNDLLEMPTNLFLLGLHLPLGPHDSRRLQTPPGELHLVPMQESGRRV